MAHLICDMYTKYRYNEYVCIYIYIEYVYIYIYVILLMEEILHHFQRSTVETSRS